VTVRHNGAVVKTIGDAIMAAFVTPPDAVSAALKMRSEIERLNEARAARDFVLKIGIHRGPSIAVTLNDRLDYFGQTVNIASRVEHLAEGDEICLTEEVYAAPGVICWRPTPRGAIIRISKACSRTSRSSAFRARRDCDNGERAPARPAERD